MLFRSLRLESQWSSCRKARSRWKVVFFGQLHGTCILSEEGKQASMANAAEQQPLLGNLLVTGAMTYHTSLKLQLDTLVKQLLQPLVEQSIVPKHVSRLGRPLLRVGWLSMLWLRSTWSHTLLNMFADLVRSHNLVAVFGTEVPFSIYIYI